MTVYPYLPKATVTTTSARAYLALLAGYSLSMEGQPNALARNRRVYLSR